MNHKMVSIIVSLLLIEVTLAFEKMCLRKFIFLISALNKKPFEWPHHHLATITSGLRPRANGQEVQRDQRNRLHRGFLLRKLEGGERRFHWLCLQPKEPRVFSAHQGGVPGGLHQLERTLSQLKQALKGPCYQVRPLLQTCWVHGILTFLLGPLLAEKIIKLPNC